MNATTCYQGNKTAVLAIISDVVASVALGSQIKLMLLLLLPFFFVTVRGISGSIIEIYNKTTSTCTSTKQDIVVRFVFSVTIFVLPSYLQYLCVATTIRVINVLFGFSFHFLTNAATFLFWSLEC